MGVKQTTMEYTYLLTSKFPQKVFPLIDNLLLTIGTIFLAILLILSSGLELIYNDWMVLSNPDKENFVDALAFSIFSFCLCNLLIITISKSKSKRQFWFFLLTFYFSVIVEALKVDSLQRLCSSLEPILRRVVSTIHLSLPVSIV